MAQKWWQRGGDGGHRKVVPSQSSLSSRRSMLGPSPRTMFTVCASASTVLLMVFGASSISSVGAQGQTECDLAIACCDVLRTRPDMEIMVTAMCGSVVDLRDLGPEGEASCSILRGHLRNGAALQGVPPAVCTAAAGRTSSEVRPSQPTRPSPGPSPAGGSSGSDQNARDRAYVEQQRRQQVQVNRCVSVRAETRRGVSCGNLGEVRVSINNGCDVHVSCDLTYSGNLPPEHARQTVVAVRPRSRSGQAPGEGTYACYDRSAPPAVNQVQFVCRPTCTNGEVYSGVGICNCPSGTDMHPTLQWCVPSCPRNMYRDSSGTCR
jgi:hypothetical protein